MMLCIQCRAKTRDDGSIKHNRGCPENLKRTMKVDMLIVNANEEPVPVCGIEHPYWENPCIHDAYHTGPHHDAEDHEWFGMP